MWLEWMNDFYEQTDKFEVTLDYLATKDIEMYNVLYNDKPILDYTKLTLLEKILYKIRGVLCEKL